MTTATISAGLQTLPLDQITENPFNPRKHFEKAPLQELADSIKVHGVRQPVLVRPMGKGFQLVVGARRLRASKLAGKADIPAIIDPELDDRSALEIMVIENLQREDVHPLDEALGYQALMEHRCYECKADAGFHRLDCPKAGELTPEITVESIAAKVGKSIGYVYARMKLLAMIPAAREAFQAGSITAGHAVLVARLQPKDQVYAIRACFDAHLSNFNRDLLKKLDPQKAKFYDIVNDEPTDSMLALMPEKGLREWIQDNVNLRLKDVPWDLADAKLFPEAGACATCEKRSASNPALFAELAVKGEDTCFDAACYGKKREAFVKLQIKEDKKRVDKMTSFPGVDAGEKQVDRIRQISEQTAYTAPTPDQRVLKSGQWLPAKKKGECPSAEEALIVNGENAGVKKLVCCNGACKVHKHHFRSDSGHVPTPKADPEAAAKHELKRKIDDALIVEILRAAVRQMKKPDAKTILCLADLAQECFYGDSDLAFAVMGVKSEKELEALRKKATVEQAMGLLLIAIMGDRDYLEAPAMKLAVKIGNANVPKLRAELEKQLAPVQTSAKPAPAAKKKAGKKGK
jgi:ParB family transcriptional regulator, chromosome partitioning protein